MKLFFGIFAAAIFASSWTAVGFCISQRCQCNCQVNAACQAGPVVEAVDSIDTPDGRWKVAVRVVSAGDGVTFEWMLIESAGDHEANPQDPSVIARINHE